MPVRRLTLAFAALAALLLAGWPTGTAAAAPAWRWPLSPAHDVLRGFDPPAHAWLPGHRGVDLAARPGQAVHAAGAGVVTFAGRVAGVGVVAVRHPGGLETTYEPVRPTVRRGEAVAAGGVIADVAATAGHCASRTCLHWGLRRGRDYLDPLSLVGAERVRLLPLLRAAGSTTWLVPAASGASVGSSAVVVGWAVLTTRRRRRPLPPGVARLDDARGRRRARDGARRWRHEQRADRRDDGEPCG